MKSVIVFFGLLFSLNAFSLERIEVIISASPGGPNDTVTRKIVGEIEKQTNLDFVFLNRPGGERVIAYNYVNNTTKPTLIFETSEIEHHEVYKKVEEIFNVGQFHNVLLVSEKSKIKNLNELIELSKKREIRFGHGSIGSFSHMASRNICEKTLQCLLVPYKSTAEGMIDLMSGTIDAYAVVSYGSKQFMDNDKYVSIHNIKLNREKSWYKLFSKNLSNEHKQTIISVLKSIDSKFFSEMGLEK